VSPLRFHPFDQEIIHIRFDHWQWEWQWRRMRRRSRLRHGPRQLRFLLRRRPTLALAAKPSENLNILFLGRNRPGPVRAFKSCFVHGYPRRPIHNIGGQGYGLRDEPGYPGQNIRSVFYDEDLRSRVGLSRRAWDRARTPRRVKSRKPTECRQRFHGRLPHHTEPARGYPQGAGGMAGLNSPIPRP
jgi:hypothetical protein